MAPLGSSRLQGRLCVAEPFSLPVWWKDSERESYIAGQTKKPGTSFFVGS